MKKITLLAFMLFVFIANAQFTTGEITLDIGMSVKIETDENQVTLTLKGPTDKWFAIGFGGTQMQSTHDVFLYDENGISDRIGHYWSEPTMDVTQDWIPVSDNIVGSQRIIVAKRNLSGSDATDYTFINDDSAIPIIYAHGNGTNGMVLAQHTTENRDATLLDRTSTANVDSKKQIKFAMYPNPAKTDLNIVLPSNIENAQVEVYDILGKIILKQRLQASFNTLDVTNIKAGIYLIKVLGDDNTFGVKQFVKK